MKKANQKQCNDTKKNANERKRKSVSMDETKEGMSRTQCLYGAMKTKPAQQVLSLHFWSAHPIVSGSDFSLCPEGHA